MKLILLLTAFISLTTRFYAQTAPVFLPAETVVASSICVNTYSSIFDTIAFRDNDFDNLTVVSATSSNQTVMPDANINVYLNFITGTDSYFYVQGQTTGAGNFAITVTLTDGTFTVPFTLPTVTVLPTPTPVFNVGQINICENNGEVNLNDYVDITGGSFYINSLEFNFNNGIFDPNNNPFNPGNIYTLSYEVIVNGCYGSADIPIQYNLSPNATISTTTTICGQQSGTATATVINAALPLSNILWTTGATGVTNITGLGVGNYTFSCSDANGCSTVKAFSIDPAGVVLIGNVVDNICAGQANGSIITGSAGLTSPISYLWSTGYSTPNLSNLVAGAYTLTATDANNCAISKTFIIQDPDPIVIGAYSYNTSCGASDGYLDAQNAVGGVGAYSYAWSTGDLTPTVSNVPFGIYSITVTDANGCQNIETVYVSESNSADLYGDITGSNCGANDGAVDLSYYIYSGANLQSISWSNGATSEDIASLAPNNYVCTFTLDNGCRAIKGWNIPIVNPERQDICVVTVDSATTTNLLVWEKVQPLGIAYYNIYRETSIENNFVLIDTVEATNLSIFNDVIASPSERSWSYKIAAVNACNVEGPLSGVHRTIHMNATEDLTNNGVNVNWNAYIGTSFSAYNIWRYTTAAGWQEVGNVASSQLTYFDNVPFSTPGLDYMIEFDLNAPCTAEKAQDFNTVRSNRERGQFETGNGTGDSNNDLDENYLNSISIYPNPFNSSITISQDKAVQSSVRILSVTGQIVDTFEITDVTTQHQITGINPGVYFVEIQHNDLKTIKRIVKN